MIGAKKAPRPAHRPSRRPVVIDGAMGLFSTIPIDEVTVADIATAVDMTPAAVYYHFASKEQILVEGMEQFRNELLDEVRKHLPAPGETDGLVRLLTHVLVWAAARRTSAVVYFVNSNGLNLVVEAVRRETRVDLVDLLRDAVTSVRGRLNTAEAGAIAVALVSLLETSMASMLNEDAAYRGLGARRFAERVAEIGDRIAGVNG